MRDPNATATLAEALAAIPPLEDRLAAAARPAADSAASRDGRTLLGRMAFDLSLTGLSIGYDHLASWHALVVRGHIMPGFAYLSLIRSALEGAVLARWLCEPKTQAERIARGAGAQWVDYDERRKMEQDAGAPTEQRGTWQPAKDRMKDIEAAARRARTSLAKPPNRTALFDRYVFPAAQVEKHGRLGQVLYRILSASAHAHQWSVLTAAQMELVDEPTSRRGSRLARVTGREDVAAVTTLIGVKAFSDALRDVERYGAPAPKR